MMTINHCRNLELRHIIEKHLNSSNEYRGELADEIAEDDLEDYIKDDDIFAFID